MKKFLGIFIALFLIFVILPEEVLLAPLDTLNAWLEEDSPSQVFVESGDYVPFSKMEYTRMDATEFQVLADEAVSLAMENDSAEAVKALETFDEACYRYLTNSNLANIHYCMNLKDRHWKEENDFYSALYSEIYSIQENMYYSLAASPCRKVLENQYLGKGFLEDYLGDSILDDALLALLDKENALINQYYDQMSDYNGNLLQFFLADEDAIVQTMVDLVRVRNQIALAYGYDSYEAYAFENLYTRDYSPNELNAYLDEIRNELVPLYRETWELAYDFSECKMEEAVTCVRDMAQKMGGTIWDTYQYMENAGLYDARSGSSRYSGAFVIDLPSYNSFFLYYDPYGTTYDCLSFAHEFGHFCNGFTRGDLDNDMDVAEIFSQGMEYLSLFYGQAPENLERQKLADSLATYVEQACFAAFEREIYKIPDNELTAQALIDVYAKTASQFGLDSGDDDFMDNGFITISHFYDSPMYVTSYIVSNDAAMQIYEMEKKQSGAGLSFYLKFLGAQENTLFAFLHETGLKSPFSSERLREVRNTFETVLLNNS